MNENDNKIVTLKQLIAAHTKSYAKVEALGERVGDLETAGGEPNVITGVKVNGAALEVKDKAIDIGASIAEAVAASDHLYVQKEDGKGLSTNDFTDEEKEKLADIEFATDEEVAAALAEIYGDDEA